MMTPSKCHRLEIIGLLIFVHLLLYPACCAAGGLGGPGFWGSNKLSRISISVLKGSIAEKPASQLTSRAFTFACGGSTFTAATTMNQELQSYLDSLMTEALGEFTAIVCLDPVSGRILALSGFDRLNPEGHVWTRRLVPSASIFKVVTAAGAIEFLGMRPNTVLTFNGGKHTLYKYQLKEKKTRYTSKVTLKEAFKDSINAVFGKIGALYLKKKGLQEMSDRFLWQKQIPLEIPVKKSTIILRDDAFSLAEVASGFNKATKITALHGALIAGAVSNRGVIMAPSFIDSIKTLDGETVYQSRIYPLTRPVNPRTADLLFSMMKATVKSGTARKAFYGYNRDRVLSRLEIGGKTGTIDNNTHELRYDWFCGIAREKGDARSMAVAVVVAHRDVLGTRAARYARLAMKKYFSILDNRIK